MIEKIMLKVDSLEILFVRICFVFRMYILQTFVRNTILSFSKHKSDIDLSRSGRLVRGKPVRHYDHSELKKALCGNILDSLRQKMNLQLKPRPKKINLCVSDRP
jgi:hypothetical protein